MMKFSLFAITIIGLCCISFAQKKYDSTPYTEIVDISWRGAVIAPYVSDRKGAFSIDVKNTSSKSIKAVTWDFWVIDKIRQRVFDKLHFETTDKTIKPNETRRLTKRYNYFSLQGSGMVAQARIVKLVFEDGTEWTRPKD